MGCKAVRDDRRLGLVKASALVTRPQSGSSAKDTASACFACHVPQAHRDYTFSELRD